MRTFGLDFAAEILKKSCKPFWSAVLHFPGRDVFFAPRPSEAFGVTHDVVLSGIGDIRTIVDRRDPRRLDLPTCDLAFTNLPVLSTGERVTGLFGPDLESVVAEVFLNFELPDGSFIQEVMLRGIVQSPAGYDFKRGAVRVMAESERFLNAPVLPILDEGHYPQIRDADNGQTIPIIIGKVSKAPGRVVKESIVSNPKPGGNNTGTGALSRPLPGAGATTQDWVATITAPETQEQVTVDGESEVGKRVASGVSVIFDNHAAVATVGSSVTIPGFVVGTGTNRQIFFGVHTNGAIVVSITAGGRIPSFVSSAILPNARVFVYKLDNPSSGPMSIVAQLSTTNASVVLTARSISNAQLGSSINALSKTDPSNGLMSNAPSSEASAGWMFIDFLTTAAATPTESGAGQQDDRLNAGGAIWAAGAHLAVATNGDYTMQWTMDSPCPLAYVSLRVHPILPFDFDQYAQSFQTASNRPLSGANLYLRKNPAFIGATAAATVELRTNAAGNPGTILATTTINFTSTVAGFVTVSLEVSLVSGVAYWLVVRATADASGHGAVLWGKNSAGGYASGNANAGNTNGDTWAGGMSGQDFAFQVQFAGTTYALVGSVTGADGTGTVGVDFTSTSGQVNILASMWSGSPAGGDKFRFSYDGSRAQVVFSLSPPETPIRAISQVYWDDQPITAGSVEQLVDDTTIDVGNATNFAVAQQIVLAAPTLVREIAVRLRLVGTPTSPVIVSLKEETSTIPGSRVLFQRTIDSTLLTTNPTEYVASNTSLTVLPAGNYQLVVETAQSDAANYYRVRYQSTNVYTGVLKTKTSAGWGTVTGDMFFKVTAVVLDQQLSTQSGPYDVARVRFEGIEIPASVQITADVVGLQDDTVGTYTGTPQGLIRRPDNVFYRLLRLAGVPMSKIDVNGTFAQSALSYGSIYGFDGVIQDQQTWKQLFLGLAFQCRSAFAWGAEKAQLKVLPTTATAAVRTITFADLVRTGERIPDLKIDRIPVEEIINTIELKWKRAPARSGETAYDAVLPRRDQVSIGRFGPLARPDLFNFDFVANETMATDLGDFYLARYASTKKRRAAPRGVLPFLDLESDDVVAFNLINPAGPSGAFPIDLNSTGPNLADAFDGLDGGQFFQLETVADRTSDFTVELVAREL